MLAIVTGAALLIAGSYFMATANHSTSGRFSPGFIRFTGYASMLFFGICFLYGFWKLFDKKMGLVIDDEGITDNASGVAAGKILWADITGVRTTQVQSTKFLLIDTVDPEKYLITKNRLKAATMRLNAKMYGTPVTIPSSALKCSFNDLERIVRRTFEANKRK